MENAAEVYRPSGQMGRGLVMFPLFGIVTALALGIAYGYLNVYNPLVYLQALAMIFYAVALGYVVAKTMVWSNCRNTAFVSIMALLTGLFALYFAWAAFTCALLEKNNVAGVSLWKCLLSPDGIWTFASLVATTGWFQVFSATPSGIVLWLFWLVEAAVIVGGTVLIAHGEAKKRVFCEDCLKWCAVKKDLARFTATTREQVAERLKAGELEALLELQPAYAKLGVFFEVEHQLCPKCGNFGTYQIRKVTTARDKEGKETKNSEDLTANLLLSRERTEKLGLVLAHSKSAPKKAPAAAAKPAAGAKTAAPSDEAPPAQES